MNKQPWIGKPLTDIIFILSPPFLCLLIVILFPGVFQDAKDISLSGWVILILLIDVGHVYSTLYRTYFDSNALKKQQTILFAIPFFSFIVAVILYSSSSLWFWRILTYVAVFHFIRQQYGFMRLYSRKEAKNNFTTLFDKIIIYTASLYPILYWHLKGPRNFNWFIENDFIFLRSGIVLNIATAIYFLLVATYIILELRNIIITRSVNVPKFCIISGTLLSWYFGIVYFNGDMAFTLLNVVSHGIPYMALIWIHGKKNYSKPGAGTRFLKLVFSKYGIIIFLAVIFLFAFIEESLWDISVWKEHKTIFGTDHLAEINISNNLLNFIVPLLALPQITHYILDGFIWKIKKDEIKWSNEVNS
ncbi:MAG: hypothetical protein QM737_07245 [Ferruginibacter sp.]